MTELVGQNPRNTASIQGVVFGVSTTGTKTVIEGVNENEKRIKDLRPIWRDVAEDFLKREKEVFRAEGAAHPWGAWRALNADYAARKRDQGFGNRIMVRTGDLKNSLTEKADPNFVIRIAKRQLTLGTKLRYAQYHQADRGREPIRITSAGRRSWTAMIRRFVIADRP